MEALMGAVQAAIGVAGKILEFSSAASLADLKNAIADLRLQLADIRLQAADLIEENREMARTIKELQSPPSVVARDNCYFTKEGDGPFCVGCHDSKRQMIRLLSVGGEEKQFSDLRYRCPVCKTTVY
ncbi:hypothetical protein VN12_20725 [Pirellula sp. SH-Sr6A]|uniref:hypothetical protein n=1 Tax=Pirellula sp. SH-Sr6A TaxID=1632865 RepID=UPI00078D7C01|nr:hypothetical protein [Pirellula sp. SH-Sr6A]AMV34561.1 hypothetical protein VN12_20725 [Pirellula sp. SH-Sr6A]